MSEIFYDILNLNYYVQPEESRIEADFHAGHHLSRLEFAGSFDFGGGNTAYLPTAQNVSLGF